MRVLHIIRDGRDVTISGWFHNLRTKGDGFRSRFPDLPKYIEYAVESHWVSYIRVTREFGRHHPDRYLELRYEQLQAEPDAQLARVLEFLGVDDSPDQVNHCVDAGRFENQTSGRRRGEEDRYSFFRKGVVGDWRNHFDRSCIDTFMRCGGDTLRELGYAD